MSYGTCTFGLNEQTPANCTKHLNMSAEDNKSQNGKNYHDNSKNWSYIEIKEFTHDMSTSASQRQLAFFNLMF